MGWLNRLRVGRRPAAPVVKVENAVDSVMNPSSFSFVVFEGDCAPAIPDLLNSCGYTVLRESTLAGDPVELMEKLRRPYGPNNSIVIKAFWSSPEITVLVDPELVVAAAYHDQLARFCAAQSTTAVAAVWERVSESAMLTEIDGSGVRRQSFYVDGSPAEGAQTGDHAEIVRQPDDVGIRLAMAAIGVPVDTVFASARATILELQE